MSNPRTDGDGCDFTGRTRLPSALRPQRAGWAESRPPRWGCWLGRVRLRRSCAAATRRGLRRQAALREPYWPLRVAHKLGMKWHEAGYPPTYTPAAHGTTRPHWTDPPTVHSSDRRRHRPHVQRESMSSCAASSATLLTTAVGPASARSSAVAAPHVTAMVAMPAARPATTSVTASPT